MSFTPALTHYTGKEGMTFGETVSADECGWTEYKRKEVKSLTV